MNPWWASDNGETQLQLACGHVLEAMPAASVHCVVTSPPYWGLRDYGLPPQVWDGDPGCGHEFEMQSIQREFHQTGATGRGFPTTTIHESTYDHGYCRCGA